VLSNQKKKHLFSSGNFQVASSRGSRFDTFICGVVGQCVGHCENVSRNILCVAYFLCVCVSGLVGPAPLITLAVILPRASASSFFASHLLVFAPPLVIGPASRPLSFENGLDGPRAHSFAITGTIVEMIHSPTVRATFSSCPFYGTRWGSHFFP
jgi:hypothetical protein